MRGWSLAVAALLAGPAGALAEGRDAGAAVERVVAAFAAFEAAAERAFAGGTLDAQGLASLAAARDGLLAAARALATHARGGPLPVPPVDIPGTLRIQPGLDDNVYERDYALVVDAGGDDTYLNNAGGAGPQYPCGNAPAAAALIDLGGDDAYGIPGIYPVRICGFNGGGAFLGAGFLYDAGGHDAYTGSAMASNGGAYGGFGSLVDEAGDDRYVAGESFNHLGTNGEGILGLGLLLDLAGRDVYDDFSEGSGVDRSVVPKALGAQVDVGGSMHSAVAAVAVEGDATATGMCLSALCVAGTAVSVAGDSSAGGCWGFALLVCGGLAASATGSAACPAGLACTAVSGTGASTGTLAASATGDSRGFVAISGTGHAHGTAAVSGCDLLGLCGA